MMDATTFRVSNIRPKRGYALIEIQEPAHLRIGDLTIYLPEEVKKRTGVGVVKDASEKAPPVEAIVRALGATVENWPYEIGLGDRVIVRRNSGTTVSQHPRFFKVIKVASVLAVFV